LDFNLVSNKIFSKILPSSSLGPGPDEVGQSGLKVYDVTHKNPEFFFHFRLEDLTGLLRFEQLSSTIRAGVMFPQRHVQTAGF